MDLDFNLYLNRKVNKIFKYMYYLKRIQKMTDINRIFILHANPRTPYGAFLLQTLENPCIRVETKLCRKVDLLEP